MIPVPVGEADFVPFTAAISIAWAWGRIGAINTPPGR